MNKPITLGILTFLLLGCTRGETNYQDNPLSKQLGELSLSPIEDILSEPAWSNTNSFLGQTHIFFVTARELREFDEYDTELNGPALIIPNSDLGLIIVLVDKARIPEALSALSDNLLQTLTQYNRLNQQFEDYRNRTLH